MQHAELQPVSTVGADQVAIDEKLIRVNGHDRWLYGAVDPKANEIFRLTLLRATTKQTTRWFLTELHRRCQLDDPLVLVDGASYLGTVLDEDGYRFQVLSNGNRNAIERVFCEIERRASSFANSFRHVIPGTSESWLEPFAVYHNARQN